MQKTERNEWIWPPADQWISVWGLWLIVLVAFLLGQLLDFISALKGTRWVWCYGITLAVAAVGISMIFFAKLPLYRERRFFTFGNQALPGHRRSHYRWGYRCLAFAFALFACLLLSKP